MCGGGGGGGGGSGSGSGSNSISSSSNILDVQMFFNEIIWRIQSYIIIIYKKNLEDMFT